jgi:signal transduction histidine kinase
VSIVFISNQIQDSIKETNQINIFRIVQELLNNALKHSNCTEIVVDCSQNEDLFLITVEDNGIGFNTNDVSNYKGLGLKNIKNRVDLLKGKLDIKSNSTSGSIFNIEIRIE